LNIPDTFNNISQAAMPSALRLNFSMTTTETVIYPYPLRYQSIHDDITLSYMDTGSGTKTILFVHGLANYAAAWKYQLSGLSSTYRCIAVDLPGNGFSSRGDFPYSMFFYAECIRQFIEQHKLTDVILCGHSMGAQVSTIVALRYPHLVSKLVLVAPAGIERFSGTDILFMQAMLNIGDFLYADEFHLETAIRDSFETASPDMPKMMEEKKTNGESAVTSMAKHDHSIHTRHAE